MFHTLPIANKGPPLVRIDLPAGTEWLYSLAGPLFLSAAAILGGWWLIRYRTFLSTTARVYFLSAAGCLAVALNAFWIWMARDKGQLWLSYFETVASDMVYLWITFAVFYFTCSRLARQTADSNTQDRSNVGVAYQWLLGLLFLAVLTCFYFVGHRPELFFSGIAVISCLILICWPLVRGMIRLAHIANRSPDKAPSESER